MIAFGVGEVVGGLLMGWFIDKYDSKKATILNLFIVFAMTAVTLESIISQKFNYLTFITTFLWGLQDGTFNTHTFQVLGSEFETQSEPFGVFSLVQGLSVFCFCMLQSQINSNNMYELLIYTGVVGVIGVISCISSFFFPFKKKKTLQQVDSRMHLVQRHSEYDESTRFGSQGMYSNFTTRLTETRDSELNVNKSSNHPTNPNDPKRYSSYYNGKDSVFKSYKAVEEKIEEDTEEDDSIKKVSVKQ